MATLLLADDSVTIQRVIELTFANESIRVVTAPDGHAATAMLESERPDIVLADVGLPAVDGYTLAERLKRNPATAAIPVLLLTGAFEPIDEGRARRTGCNGVLVKPFEPHRVVSLVKTLLAGKTPDNLWPNDMPRIDGAGTAAATDTPPASPSPHRPQAPRRESVSEPGMLPPPSAIEEVFEIGLDDLDLAFSRLDPVAPPSRIDADSVSDFQRDIQQLRNEAPEPVAPAPAPPRAVAEEVVSHLPVEEVSPVEAGDLEWDLPAAPGTVIEAIPLPASFPVEPPSPPPPPPPAPSPVPAPEVSTPWVEPPAVEAPSWEPPVPSPPPSPPSVEAPAASPSAAAPPTLAAAFSALLAAEQSQPNTKPAPGRGTTSEATVEVVEQVARRVAERLTAEVDRLVREELERLKR